MARRKAEWENLCNAMEDNGLLCYQVAAEVGITPYTFSRWVHEEPRPERTEKVKTAILALLAKRPGFNA